MLGAATQAQRALVSVASKIQESADLNVKKRHGQSLRLTFDSLLISQANAQTVTDRLLALFKKRFDVVTLTYFFSELPRISLGMTVVLTYPRLSYDGVNMVVVNYTVDVQLKSVVFVLAGYRI